MHVKYYVPTICMSDIRHKDNNNKTTNKQKNIFKAVCSLEFRQGPIT